MINEIKNQHVHLFWGLLICLVTGFNFSGLIIGVIVEAYQKIFKKEDWKISDRLLDIGFWGLSGILAYGLREWIK